MAAIAPRPPGGAGIADLLVLLFRCLTAGRAVIAVIADVGITGGITPTSGAPSREAEEGEGCDEAGGVRWRLLPWESIWRPTPDAVQSRQARW